MIKPLSLLAATASLLILFTVPALQAQTKPTPPPSGEILGALSKSFSLSSLIQHKAVASLIEQDGKTKIKIEFNKGGEFPGVQFLKSGEVRDLSAFSGVQAIVTNLGKDPLKVGLRADNAGDWHDSPWSSNGALIPPGKTQIIRVTFGETWGQRAFALNPKAVTGISIFGYNPPAGSAIAISDIKAVK